MSDLSQDEPEKLPLDDFGDPAKRGYPIVHASDGDDAAHLIGLADDQEAVKRRIIAISKRNGFAMPSRHPHSWAAPPARGQTPAHCRHAWRRRGHHPGGSTAPARRGRGGMRRLTVARGEQGNRTSR